MPGRIHRTMRHVRPRSNDLIGADCRPSEDDSVAVQMVVYVPAYGGCAVIVKNCRLALPSTGS